MKRAVKRSSAVLFGAMMLVVALTTGPAAFAAEDARLDALWAQLSDSDRVAIKTASGKVGTTLQTVKGTANDKFWSELGSRGLLRSVTLVEIFGAEAETFEKAGLVAFAVTPKGKESIPGLVEDLEK